MLNLQSKDYIIELENMTEEEKEYLLENYLMIKQATELLGIKRGQLINFMISYGMISYVAKDIYSPQKNIGLFDSEEDVGVILTIGTIGLGKHQKKIVSVFTRRDVLEKIKSTEKMMNEIKSQPCKLLKNNGGK